MVLAHGTYSTRDKFLGKASGNWRPIEDINENDIRSAARHICIGNGIKTLLGLRGIPSESLREIFESQGTKADAVKTVTRTKGSQGGTNADDLKLQKEIAAWLAEMYGAENIEDQKEALRGLTAFKGDKGKEVSCDSIANLKGKWLQATHHKLKEKHAEYEQMTGGGEAE